MITDLNQAIGMLRQFINEEHVHTNKLIDNRAIHIFLDDAIAADKKKNTQQIANYIRSLHCERWKEDDKCFKEQCQLFQWIAEQIEGGA